MNKTSGIYKITNTCNGKIYVGSAVNLKNRKSCHLFYLRKNNHTNRHLQQAFNKYGENNFKFEIIELVEDKESLLIREQYWIDKLNVCNREIGYNICPTAGNTFGRKHTEGTKRKIGLKSKEKVFSLETRRLRAEIAKKFPEHLRSLSELNKKKVINLTTGLIFDSQKEASEYYGIQVAGISGACRGIYKKSGGYRWSYYKEEGVA